MSPQPPFWISIVFQGLSADGQLAVQSFHMPRSTRSSS